MQSVSTYYSDFERIGYSTSKVVCPRLCNTMYFVCVFFLQSFLGGLFGPVCEIDVLLNDAENRKTAELKTEDGKVEKHYLFYDGESVSGKVN